MNENNFHQFLFVWFFRLAASAMPGHKVFSWPAQSATGREQHSSGMKDAGGCFCLHHRRLFSVCRLLVGSRRVLFPTLFRIDSYEKFDSRIFFSGFEVMHHGYADYHIWLFIFDWSGWKWNSCCIPVVG